MGAIWGPPGIVITTGMSFEEHCIAHLNLDLLGSKGADHTLAIRTAGLEGEEWLKEQVRKVDPAAEMMFGRIGRGADQSLWGAEIPYHINPRYEAKKRTKAIGCSGSRRVLVAYDRRYL